MLIFSSSEPNGLDDRRYIISSSLHCALWASKDGSVRMWIVNTGQTEYVFGGHEESVSCVKWGAGSDKGTGPTYTANHDKTVKVWNAVKGMLVQTLSTHAY